MIIETNCKKNNGIQIEFNQIDAFICQIVLSTSMQKYMRHCVKYTPYSAVQDAVLNSIQHYANCEAVQTDYKWSIFIVQRCHAFVEL